MTTIAKIQSATGDWNNYKNSFGAAGSSLSNVVAFATIVYNNSTFGEVFPQSFTAYQQYLLNLRNYINGFVAGLPVEPPLNG